MKITIDIGHPAHVHLFHPFALEMQKKGHKILFTCRQKEFEMELLEAAGFDYVTFGKHYTTTFGKLWGLLKFDIKMLVTAIKFKPDIFLSHGSMYAAHASFLLNKPHISLEDTYNSEQVRLYKPFTEVILTSDYDHPLESPKAVKYAGYHELAYLHPNRFTPDIDILQDLGISDREKYIIIRFVSWNATHDAGHKGISFENKIKVVNEFGKYAKVFISSEAELPEELKPFQIRIEPQRMHDALAFASLVFGESSTMAEEAAMLGVPSIYLFNNSTYYTKHLENKYELLLNYSESEADQIGAIKKGVEMLNSPHIKQVWQKRKNKMLADKIDVTAFLVWFIEDYPESYKIMREIPDYQYKFK